MFTTASACIDSAQEINANLKIRVRFLCANVIYAMCCYKLKNCFAFKPDLHIWISIIACVVYIVFYIYIYTYNRPLYENYMKNFPFCVNLDQGVK